MVLDGVQQRYFVNPVINFWGARHETKEIFDQLLDEDSEL
jgi:hypothetical protein